MRRFGGARCVRLLAALSLLGVFAAPLVAGGANPAEAAAAPPVPRASVPPTPINLRVYNVFSSQISWAWTNVDPTANVTVSDGTTATPFPPGIGYFTKQDIPPGSYGCLSVSAWNEAGSSPWSDWVCSFVRPLTPLNFHVTGVTASTVSFAWQNNDTISYNFAWESRWDGGANYHLLGQNATSYTATGVPPGYYSCVEVSAYNAQFMSPYTNWQCAHTPPAAPSGVHRSSSTPTSVTFTWTNQDQWSTIVLTNDSVHLTSLGSNAGTYSQTGMAPGSWVCISVVAVNSWGTSNYTTWACGQAV